jgi:hypothetical protein
MSADAFDRLLYTDCRAGTGRGAGGGFQVQAQSADVDPAQSTMAVSWLLYDAQTAWIMQDRAVEDFPPGFAHACKEGYGTAQSRYVGKEATGGREGNHLTDCLLTRDPDLYGPTRPAQLWRSDLWRAEPWDGRDCPQLVDPPPPGPLTVDAVAAWLQSRPERAPVLAKLLSVLENPAGRRVVITASAPQEALLWIASATLLLPIRSALEVSFKVFCANPQRAAQRVIAVPRELNAQIVPGRAEPTFVLDAEGCASDSAEVSERASFWVERFATAADPYDVVDAVELAEPLDPGADGARADAMITAWAVTAFDQPLADPAALLRCLSAANPPVRLEHGASIVRRILAANPPTSALRWIDTAAALGQIEVDRVEVRGLLLTAEMTEARRGCAPPPEVLSSVAVSAQVRRDADSELSSAIVLGADPEVDMLLRLSRRHGIEPQLPPLLERLRMFALNWMDHPGLDYRPDDWALRAEILDLAHAELRLRLAKHDTAGVLNILQRLWPYFADRAGDPTDPLDCHLEAAAIRALPMDQRRSRMSALIDKAQRAPSASTVLADVQRALVAWQAIGPAEASLLLLALPASVPVAREVLDLALKDVERTAGRPTGPMLDVLGALNRRSPVPLTDQLGYLLAQDRGVMGFAEATRTPRFMADNGYARQLVGYLGQVEPAVIRARLGPLLEACLDFEFPGLGCAVLCVLPSPEPRLLIDLWARELGGPRGTRATVWAVSWVEDPVLPDKLRSRIEAAIDKFASTLKPDDRDQWILDVRAMIPAEQARTWARLAGFELAKPRRGRRARLQEEG